VPRVTIVLGSIAALLLLVGTLGSAPAGAAVPPQPQLVMPQGTAFSILGHDCGGIKEDAYVTGFDDALDPAAGYPTGFVLLTTRCSTGGRGGGTATFTAWTADTWDPTGALLSYSVSSAPSVDPSFSATDPLTGNEIYNSAGACPGTGGTGSTAYACLQWADTFTPRPRVTGLATSVGPANGGTSVTISGDGFTAATDVDFGGTPAASVTVNSDSSITAVSPVDASGVSPDSVDVTVVSPGGTSFRGASDTFTSYARPAITGLHPNHGSVTGGYYVTVSGMNFVGTTGVTVGEASTSWLVVNNTTMSVYIPAGDAVAGDTASISMTSVGGTSPSTPADTFRYTAPAAVAASPHKGIPGTLVKVSGVRFIAGETVTVRYLTGLASPRPAEVTICAAKVKGGGAFVCKGKIPGKFRAGAKGAHELVASGAAGDSAATTFTRS
jgi:IPT/TIG domain